MPDYNPYLPLQMEINGQPMTGRPFIFSAEIEDHVNFTDKDGKIVIPTVLSTLCPDCGQGLDVNVQLLEYPFPVIKYSCPLCRPALPPMPDPFVNPLDDERVASYFVDSTVSPDELNSGNLTITELQKLLDSPMPSETVKIKPKSKPKPKPKPKSEPKSNPVPDKPAPVESTFNDKDLVEP